MHEVEVKFTGAIQFYTKSNPKKIEQEFTKALRRILSKHTGGVSGNSKLISVYKKEK